jgi:hypothetical protein
MRQTQKSPQPPTYIDIGFHFAPPPANGSATHAEPQPAAAAIAKAQPGLWDIGQAAAYLQVADRTVKAWDREGRFPPGLVVRLGGNSKRCGRLLFSRAVLEKWVAAGCPRPQRPKKRR